MKKLFLGALTLTLFAVSGVYVRQGRADQPKVKVCHMPQPYGHIIEISVNALPAHLAHGDFETQGDVGASCSMVLPQ
jgi:hypothetical protein